MLSPALEDRINGIAGGPLLPWRAGKVTPTWGGKQGLQLGGPANYFGNTEMRQNKQK